MLCLQCSCLMGSQGRTKIQAFNDTLDAVILSVPVCGEDVVVMERFTYCILAVIFMSLLAMTQRSIDIWVRPEESWIHWIMGCGAVGPCAGGQSPSLQVLGASSLAQQM